MIPEMDVSVVIANWNTRELLRKCIRSIYEKTKKAGYQIVVVDNGSQDNSQEMVREEFPDIRLIANEKNRGFSRANNQGIREATGRYVLLLNSDTEFNNNVLSIMVKFLDGHPDVGASGCKLLNTDRTVQPSCANFSSSFSRFCASRSLKELVSKLKRNHNDFPSPFLSYDEHQSTQEVEWVVGADLLVKRDVIEKIGLLDENIFIYAEDWDYCFRIKKAGWKIVYNPEAEIIHHCSMSSIGSMEEKRVFDIFNSIHYFYKKHYGTRKAFFIKLMTLVGAVIKLFLWLIFLIRDPHNKEFIKSKIQWHKKVLQWGVRTLF